LAATSGYARRAVRLYGAAAALREALGAPVPPADRDRNERILARARKDLHAEVFQERSGIGHAMSAEQAVEEALTFLRQVTVRTAASDQG
jgi:hypothetical protein